MCGRTLATSADRTEIALREVSADTLLAGALGLVCGVLTGAGIAWPLFFVPDPLIAMPLFGIVVAVLGYLGFRIGASSATAFSRSSAAGPASLRATPARPRCPRWSTAPPRATAASWTSSAQAPSTAG